MMTEQLFQYLWENALFNPLGLSTTMGERLTILSPGRINRDAGPDFKEGRIRIGNTIWVGNIELHLKSSDWLKHGHQRDASYQNIILHVVLDDDIPISDNFPTLALKDNLNKEIIRRYEGLMEQPDHIPCHDQLYSVPEIIMESWLTRLLAERWEQKLAEWENLWQQAGRDWRTLLYYRMAANFGFHVNRDAFLDLALSLPLNILARHRKNLLQTEALLFGQAGLLPGAKQDDYARELEKEYHFLRRKYALSPMNAARWKFMRMRPANFPTLRIAQFAMLVHKSLNLFSQMMEFRTADEFFPLLDLKAGTYWDSHYRFSERAKDQQEKKLGKAAVHNILINTVAPMQFLYSKLQGKANLQEASIELLQSIPPENNNIIRAWKDRGIRAKDASASQALIQLFQHYCTARNCLHCAIGNSLLRRT